MDGWDEDLVEIAYDEASREDFIGITEGKLCIPPQVAAFVRSQTKPALPSQLLTAHTEAFCQAARAVVCSPSDATTEALLDYRLERNDWDHFGRHVSVVLTLEARTIAGALISIDRTGRSLQAMDWLLRAIPPIEAVASNVDVRTDHGEAAIRMAYHIFVQIADLYGVTISKYDATNVNVDDEVDDAIKQPILEAIRYLQKAANAAEQLIVVNPQWSFACGSHRGSIAHLMRRLGQYAEARAPTEQAVALLSDAWRQIPIPQSSRIEKKADTRVILIESLVVLGRVDEAMKWFDEAVEDAREGPDAWVYESRLAKFAFRLGEVEYIRNRRSDEAFQWLSRAVDAYEHLDTFTLSNDVYLGRTLYMVSRVLLAKLGLVASSQELASLQVKLDVQAVDVAWLWIERLFSYIDNGRDRPDKFAIVLLTTGSSRLLELGAFAYHLAGLPGKALAQLERAEEISDEYQISIDKFESPSLELIRGLCLRALNRIDDAANAFVLGLSKVLRAAREESSASLRWGPDSVGLEITWLHAELCAILDEPGVAAILAEAQLSLHEICATACMHDGYLAAHSNRPDDAAQCFERAHAMAGQAGSSMAFNYAAMAVAHAIALSYARADHVDNAIVWAAKITSLYPNTPISAPSANFRTKILERRARGGTTFEAIIDAVADEQKKAALATRNIAEDNEESSEDDKDDDSDLDDSEIADAHSNRCRPEAHSNG